MFTCINGIFVKNEHAKVSVFDNGFMYGDGFYDTMRTYEGKILEHNLHLKRIHASAKVLGIKVRWSLADIKKWTEQLVAKNKIKSGRVRVTITRGNQGFDFLHCDKATLVITAEELHIDSRIYSEGVAVVTMPLTRILPQIKTLGLTVMIQAYRTIAPKQAYEVILVNERREVTEGASTSIFWIRKGVVYTTATGILPGLTRRRVIFLALKQGFQVKLVTGKIKELYRAEEIFLTNRPREIIPVVKIDKHPINKGRIGPTTKFLMEEYQNYISAALKLK